MKVRVCTKCREEKQLSEFNFKIKKLGTRQYQCKECTRAFVRSHYERNKQYYLTKTQKWNIEKKKEVIGYIKNYFLLHPCIDCGESDITVLEFDHRKDKFKAVASLMRNGYPLPKIKEEIQKCDVRCANCHRRKTAKERSWLKCL